MKIRWEMEKTEKEIQLPRKKSHLWTEKLFELNNVSTIKFTIVDYPMNITLDALFHFGKELAPQ